MGSCLRILLEPGFYQCLGVFPLVYWGEGSLSLILAAVVDCQSPTERFWLEQVMGL